MKWSDASARQNSIAHDTNMFAGSAREYAHEYVHRFGSGLIVDVAFAFPLFDVSKRLLRSKHTHGIKGIKFECSISKHSTIIANGENGNYYDTERALCKSHTNTYRQGACSLPPPSLALLMALISLLLFSFWFSAYSVVIFVSQQTNYSTNLFTFFQRPTLSLWL